MQLTNEVRINRPPQEVFEALLDVEKVATCMPGSRLIGQVDDDTYQGEVKIKIGPLVAAYTGTVRFLEIDREKHTATLKASGKEQRGQGNADAHVTARVVPDGQGATVAIETDLMIRGKVAQFGRGVIGEVSQRLIGQFAQNVEQLLTGQGAASPGPRPVQAGGVAASMRPEEPEATQESTLDGIGLVLVPVLKRFAPVAVAVGVGLLVGLRLRRRSAGASNLTALHLVGDRAYALVPLSLAGRPASRDE